MEVQTEKIMRQKCPLWYSFKDKTNVVEKWNKYMTGREILTVNTAEKKEKAKQQATPDSTHVAVGLRLATLLSEKQVVLV